jgi:hypothetical protein
MATGAGMGSSEVSDTMSITTEIVFVAHEKVDAYAFADYVQASYITAADEDEEPSWRPEPVQRDAWNCGSKATVFHLVLKNVFGTLDGLRKVPWKGDTVLWIRKEGETPCIFLSGERIIDAVLEEEPE